MSTYLPSAHVDLIVRLAAQEIRTFLSSACMDQLEGEALEAIQDFRANPAKYRTEKLVEHGNDRHKAIDQSVRIEIRNQRLGDAAQVVAKGIWGPTRQQMVERLVARFKSDGLNIHVRMAGSSSFEFNVLGVDKSLPIMFLRASLPEVLKQIHYSKGTCIDSFKTKTIIAADGDGTIYEGPKVMTALPTVAGSPVKQDLINYLNAGGIFLLISGNDIDRSIDRIVDGIPSTLFNRILIAGNGGADLMGFNRLGKPEHIRGYHGLKIGKIKDNYDLDIVYIGDDGSESGNDWPAFSEVGLHRSVLVAKAWQSEYNEQLKSAFTPGQLLATQRFFSRVNDFARNNPYQPLFDHFFGGMYGEY